MYLRRALDNVHFHRKKKVTIYQTDAAEKLRRYQAWTLSYIKANIINAPRNGTSGKKHRISEKLNKEKYLHLSPPFFFVVVVENKSKKNNKTATQEKKKKNLVQACKVRANLTSRTEVWWYQDRKAAARCAM
jgi:hypothetical protein